MGKLKWACDFDGYMYGASYPDAMCVDGMLIDMDRGYSTDYDTPCPKCNIREFAEYAGFSVSGNAKQRRTELRKFQRKVVKNYESV